MCECLYVYIYICECLYVYTYMCVNNSLLVKAYINMNHSSMHMNHSSMHMNTYVYSITGQGMYIYENLFNAYVYVYIHMCMYIYSITRHGIYMYMNNSSMHLKI